MFTDVTIESFHTARARIRTDGVFVNESAYPSISDMTLHRRKRRNGPKGDIRSHHDAGQAPQRASTYLFATSGGRKPRRTSPRSRGQHRSR